MAESVEGKVGPDCLVVMPMLQRRLPALLVFTLAAACGGTEHTTKGSNGGQAGSGVGASGSGGGRGGSSGTAGAAGTNSAAGGASANGGRAGSAGAVATGGNAAAGAAGASAGVGGTAAGEGGTGAEAGEAGTGAGLSQGGADDGGTGNATGSDVHGKLIDFWRHPVPGAPVAIGGVRVVTDSNGAFVVPDVAAEYDVSFIITSDNPGSVYGWVYQGLTRRDPTLQVFKAFGAHSVGVELHPLSGSAPFTGDYRWLLGFGSPNGKGNSTSEANGVIAYPDWQGPTSNDWTLHSLYVVRTSALPTSYRAYDASVIPVTAGDEPHYPPDIDLTTQTLDTGNVSGSVTVNTGANATNSVFVRFTSGAALPIVNAVATSGSTPDYSYLVPTLPNGSITVAAAETQDDGAYAVVHQDGLAAGATNVDLTVPIPTVPSMPASAATAVDDSTTFAFGSGDPDAHAYLVHLEDEVYNDGLFIVTARKQFTLAELPVVNGEFHIHAGEWHRWWVETHGKPVSVDAMAAPGGFADAFALDGDRPAGPPDGSGQFTSSKRLEFQAAP